MMLALLNLTGTLALSAIFAGPAAVRPGDPVEHARPRLIAEKTGVAPGGTIWVGVTFEIDEHWHLYWDGQNDTGMAVKDTWTVPEGSKLGKLQWPTPERGVYPLDVIDYIYEKRVTAISQLSVPKDAKIGSKVTISASLKWLVCEEICIPGNGDVSLDIDVVAPGATVPESADAKHFADTRKRIPKAGTVTIENGQNEEIEGQTASPLVGKWEGSTLRLSVEGAQGLVFYPDAACSTMTDAIRQGESKRGTLRFSLEAKGGTSTSGNQPHNQASDQSGPLRASGIVEVRYAEPRPAEYFSIAVLRKEAGR